MFIIHRGMVGIFADGMPRAGINMNDFSTNASDQCPSLTVRVNAQRFFAIVQDAASMEEVHHTVANCKNYGKIIASRTSKSMKIGIVTTCLMKACLGWGNMITAHCNSIEHVGRDYPRLYEDEVMPLVHAFFDHLNSQLGFDFEQVEFMNRNNMVFERGLLEKAVKGCWSNRVAQMRPRNLRRRILVGGIFLPYFKIVRMFVSGLETRIVTAAKNPEGNRCYITTEKSQAMYQHMQLHPSHAY